MFYFCGDTDIECWYNNNTTHHTTPPHHATPLHHTTPHNTIPHLSHTDFTTHPPTHPPTHRSGGLLTALAPEQVEVFKRRFESPVTDTMSMTGSASSSEGSSASGEGEEEEVKEMESVSMAVKKAN